MESQRLLAMPRWNNFKLQSMGYEQPDERVIRIMVCIMTEL